MTVLIRRGVDPSNGADPNATWTNIDTLYESDFVQYQPAEASGEPHPTLNIGCESLSLTGNYVAFVMNANGKTVATYHGHPPIYPLKNFA